MSADILPVMNVEASGSADVIPLRVAVRAWFLISLQTFGGPAGQIAVMQRVLVDEKRWIGQQRFLHALNFCMLLPGPEAQQLAIYIGWLLNGTSGGLVAGTLFVIPGVVALLALSALYVTVGTTTAVTALFAGISAAVLSIVAQAVIRVGRRALHHRVLVALAVAAFVAISLFAVPFPIVVAAAGLAGWVLGRFAPGVMEGPTTHAESDGGTPPLIRDDALHSARPSLARAARVLAISLFAWGVPLALVVWVTGRHSVFTDEGLFFSGTALITFGGAYAVLAFVSQQAVHTYGWVTANDMVRGLGLAETTPGPLIMVVQFVAFLGAYRNPGSLSPWTAAILGSLLTTWVTFVPCFLFILLGAPYIERLRGNRNLSTALSGITAAVVGVIANLALFFTVHTLFTKTSTRTVGPLHLPNPDLTTIKPYEVLLTALALVLILVVKWPALRVMAICAVLGLAGAAPSLLT
jgi:chromate transporter